jgi:O-antigen/teichoic acid export membrane protein/glycosyltransferase involved in cell wall biosynthesis
MGLGISLKLFNDEGTFASRPEAHTRELRRLAIGGAGATLLGGGMTLAIQVMSTILLARILTPTDFGLIAIVTTFSLLLVNFGFNGLTEAIVQRDEMTDDLASSLFWVNTGFGAMLTILFAESGSLLATVFHDPPLRAIAGGISLTIIATSLSTVHLALLKRAMLFSWLSVNDVCARLISVGVSIILALLGFGYWALVVGAIALPVCVGIGGWFLCRWTPSTPRRAAGLKEALLFALHTYGNFAVNYASRNTDNLLVGWRFNAQALGFYKKAYDLFALSANQLVASIAIVVVGALSRVSKNAGLYRRYLLDAMAVMAFIGMGVGACLTLIGKDLIYVLLGPKWGPAGSIFVFFGPGIGVMILYLTHGWIHLSIGRPDRWFRWAIVEFFVTCTLFILCLRWGPIGVASAWSLSFWALLVPAIWYAGKPISLSVTLVLGKVWRFIAASWMAGVGAFLIKTQFQSFPELPGIEGALIRITLCTSLVATLYLASVVLLHGGIGPLREWVEVIQEMIHPAHAAPVQSLVDAKPQPLEAAFQNLAVSGAETPLVSILIPAHNAEEWISATLQSALSQTWPRIEIIVVDDGSTDGTLEAARRLEPLGVKVFSQKNQGASAARNFAFEQSSGDYIQWLDADDLLAPEKIARQMEVVMRGLSPRMLLSGPWGYFMYRANRASFVPTALWCDLSPKEWLMRKMGQNVFMQTATWLVSRELTAAAGPWDIRMLGDDDGEYFCRVLLASEGVRFVPDSRVYYRSFRFGSLSYIGRFPEKIEAHWLSMQLHIKYLRSIGDDAATRDVCVQFLRDSLIYFYPEKPHIFRQAERLAEEMGKPLGFPSLSWKYLWVERLFGWGVVKPVQNLIRKSRWRLAKEIDFLLFRLQGQDRSFAARLRVGKSEYAGDRSQLA